ncbi:hypothetical protein GEMRC1_006055 [Eukaryota sp. GEM-RC1]
MPPAKSTIRFKSPAEFFAENKNIAGFDNPGKSLYTTIREFVENSLDAAESVPALPQVDVTIEEVSQHELNTLIGVSNSRKRIDEDLYVDVDNVPSKETDKKPKKKSQECYYRVTCQDNGIGLAHDDIPNAFGRVLAGTKYGVRQTRGKFGLGAKMALIWSKMSTGLPISIESSQHPDAEISKCILDIDIRKNRPNIQEHTQVPNLTGFRGTKISVVIAGAWTTYKAKIAHYMRLLAVITPHAQFSLTYTPDQNKSTAFSVRFARRSDVIPPAPRTVQHHPRSVHLILVKQLMQETTNRTLKKFLMNDFQCIDSTLANSILRELGLKASDPVTDLSDSDVASLVKLFSEIKFPEPDGDCLSPAGEYNLRLGIMKEINPTFVATYQHTVSVFEGHPFIVEAGPGSDVVTKTANKDVKWGNYKIKQTQDKIGVFVSLVSTKIPFKGTGKEYIGDDCLEIKDAVKASLMQCCAQLKNKLALQAASKARGERKKNLVKYVPDVSRAVYEVLADMNDASQSIKSEKDHSVVADVSKGKITATTLSKQLELYVEKTDADQALDYAAEQGRIGAQISEFFLNVLTKDEKEMTFLQHSKFLFGVCSSVFGDAGHKKLSNESRPVKKMKTSDDEFDSDSDF